MKRKVKDTLDRKNDQLLEIERLILLEKKSSVLKDLFKNEIEIKAQISILSNLLQTN